MGERCAVCGENKTPTTSYSIPPECIVLMKDSSDIDSESIAGSVTFFLCDEDAAFAAQLVDRGISPLPECSARYAAYTSRRRWISFVKRLIAPYESRVEQLDRDVDLREEMLAATIVVAAALHRDVDVLQYVPESKVVEAKLVFLSLGELGILRGPLVDALRDEIAK